MAPDRKGGTTLTPSIRPASIQLDELRKKRTPAESGAPEIVGSLARALAGVRGPAGTNWGPNAVNGIINIITGGFGAASRLLHSGIVWALLAAACTGAEEPPVEYAVKAAFLLNFAEFTEWPESAFSSREAPIAVCVWGKDPFGRKLDEILQGETVRGRKLEARRIGAGQRPQSCHILFVDPELKEVRQLLWSVDPGTLTVGEGSQFLADGGIIAFVQDERKIRFEINQAAAEERGLKLSSRLLSIAKPVKK